VDVAVLAGNAVPRREIAGAGKGAMFFPFFVPPERNVARVAGNPAGSLRTGHRQKRNKSVLFVGLPGAAVPDPFLHESCRDADPPRTHECENMKDADSNG